MMIVNFFGRGQILKRRSFFFQLVTRYERALYVELKDILGQADRWKEREIGNLKRVQAKTPEEILIATGKDKEVRHKCVPSF